MSETFPSRPGDIAPDTSLVTIAERYYAHLWPVIGDRHPREHLTREEFAAHAVAVLAYQSALADRAAAGRWVTAVDALAAGLSVEQVATAGGFDVEQLRIGIAVWASGQCREGLITPERYADVLALIGEVPE